MKANPTVTLIGGTLNKDTIGGLLNAIKWNTGLVYGYMPQRIIDGSIKSVVLTLNQSNARNHVSKKNQELVTATITGWALGFGMDVPGVQWPEM